MNIESAIAPVWSIHFCIVLRRVSKDSLLTFLMPFSYHSIMLCLFFMNFPLQRKATQIRTQIKERKCMDLSTLSVPSDIYFFLSNIQCEIYHQRVQIGRIGNSWDQRVQIGRLQTIRGTKEFRQEQQGGNCGEHELSKDAGFRKSLWVPFLVT